MCGIAGLINLDVKKKAEADILESMSESIRHRGPDDEGFYCEKNIGLGHRRLSIIDLEGGHQPMTNEDETIWLVFNGEIYNYLELRTLLINRGHKVKTFSDSEVIIHLYEEYGSGCVDKLNGMFAFALWDSGKKRLFMARDRLGIKPFYYYLDSDIFLFASEIKALIQHPSVEAKPDFDAISEYLTFQYCLDDKTLFGGVKKLLPGYYAILKPGERSFSLTQYWDVDYSVDFQNDEDYFSDKLLMLIEDSVRLQLRSDVPVGAHLSGGLDSSVVTCLASSMLNSKLKTFTGGFKESPDYDETRYARNLSDAVGTDYFEIFPSAKDFKKTLPEMIYHLDEPVAGPGVFPQYFVSKLASDNVKVVLGGQGGDELFGGYARYTIGYLEQCLKSSILGTQEEGKYVVTLDSIIPNLHILAKYKPLLQYFWSDGLFESMDKRYFRLINRRGDPDFFTNRSCDKIKSCDSIFNGFKKIFDNPGTSSYLNKMTYFDTKTLLPALLHVEDRMSMAVSLESRVPLLDHRIVDLMARIPPTIKFKGGASKSLFKRAVRNIVPKEILEREDKMGFPVPLTEWYAGPLNDFLHKTLLDGRCENRGLFDVKNLENAIEAEKQFGRHLWGILCLELWFRRFIDGQT